MSLNCLTFQALQRTHSDKECVLSPDRSPRPRFRPGVGPGSGSGSEVPAETNLILRKVCCASVERRWSGNLSPPTIYEKIGRSGSSLSQNMKKVKKNHRRRVSAPVGSDKPRLVRSGGVRRDWSFENLRERSDAAKTR